MNTSEKIREIRERLKIKQIDMAQRLNIEQSKYSRLENKGDDISLTELKQIAEVFGMSVVEIIAYSGSGSPAFQQKEALILDYVARMCGNGANFITLILKIIKEKDDDLYARLDERYQVHLNKLYEKELKYVEKDDEYTKEGLKEAYTKSLEMAFLETSMLLLDASDEIRKIKQTYTILL